MKLYCKKCKTKTSVEDALNWTVLHDTPKVIRIILAILTLGITEYLNKATIKDKYVCRNCGNILEQ